MAGGERNPHARNAGRNLTPMTQLAKQSTIATIAVKVTRHNANHAQHREESVKNVARRTISNAVKRRSPAHGVTEIKSSDSNYIDTVLLKLETINAVSRQKKFLLRCSSRINPSIFMWTVEQQSMFYHPNSSQMKKLCQRTMYYRCGTRRS